MDESLRIRLCHSDDLRIIFEEVIGEYLFGGLRFTFRNVEFHRSCSGGTVLIFMLLLRTLEPSVPTI